MFVRNASGGFVRVEIKSFEREDAISFRKAKIKSDLVGIEPGRVDNMIAAKLPCDVTTTPFSVRK